MRACTKAWSWVEKADWVVCKYCKMHVIQCETTRKGSPKHFSSASWLRHSLTVSQMGSSVRLAPLDRQQQRLQRLNNVSKQSFHSHLNRPCEGPSSARRSTPCRKFHSPPRISGRKAWLVQVMWFEIFDGLPNAYKPWTNREEDTCKNIR